MNIENMSSKLKDEEIHVVEEDEHEELTLE